MTSLWIVGGGGAALEVWAVVRALASLDRLPGSLAGFLVPEPQKCEIDTEGLPVRAEQDFLRNEDPSRCQVVLALGEPPLRSKLAGKYSEHRFQFPVLVHPSAILGPQVKIGPGSVLMANAVLETHVSIGQHSLINVGVTIGHNGTLGDCCSLGPGSHLAGKVTLGDRCDIGVGVSIRPRVTLGSDVVVGAGAAVVSDHPGRATLAGVPARVLGKPE